MPAVALCDRDGVYGAPRFTRAALDAGVKPIIGSEITLTYGSRLLLPGEDREGYQTLCHLTTRMKVGAAKGSAAVTLAELAPCAAGLVCLTGGAYGPLALRLDAGDVAGARGALERLVTIFGRSSCYVEVQRHLEREQERVVQGLVALARAAHIPLVATSQPLHARPEGRLLADVFTCIREKTDLDHAGRLLAVNGERRLRSDREMTRLFHDLPDALTNTGELALRLGFTLKDLASRFPDFPLPPGQTPLAHLRELVARGVRARYGTGPLATRARCQVAHEIDVIGRLDLAGYFLIVWDIVESCRANDILVQGRGSAANSAVCYALGITAGDPVGMELPFERFLSEARGDTRHARLRRCAARGMRIQHLPRRLGQHSGGMVIAAGRLDDVVPLEPATMPGRVVVQWDKDDCAGLGIIKIDLLGLGMMAVLQDSLTLVRETGREVDLGHLPPDDPAVYRGLQQADTIGVFQVESRAQMATLPRIRPERFYDLVVQVAIIRPGPIVGQMVHPYVRRRRGREPVTYPHPSLEPILRRTLGVPLFQEQLLRMAMVAAGFTATEAQELRRAFGFKRDERPLAALEAKPPPVRVGVQYGRGWGRRGCRPPARRRKHRLDCTDARSELRSTGGQAGAQIRQGAARGGGAGDRAGTGGAAVRVDPRPRAPGGARARRARDARGRRGGGAAGGGPTGEPLGGCPPGARGALRAAARLREPTPRDDRGRAACRRLRGDGRDARPASDGDAPRRAQASRRAERARARRRGERDARPGGGQRHRSPAAGDRQGVRLPLPGGRDGYRERDRDATALRAPSPDAGDRAVPPRGGNRAAAGRRRLGSRDPGRGPLADRPPCPIPRFRMIVLRTAGPPDYSAETGELTMVATEQAAAFRYATVFCRKRPLSLVREPGPPTPPRLLERSRAGRRAHHFSRRTEQPNVARVRRHLFVHHTRQ